MILLLMLQYQIDVEQEYSRMLKSVVQEVGKKIMAA